MRLKYLGLLILIIGFATPYTLKVTFPNFLYASVPVTICFWAGFLLILQSVGNNHKYNPYFQWARYAVLFNIILTILLILYFYLILYLDIRRGAGLDIMFFLNIIVNPVTSVFDRLVALPVTEQANGSIRVTHSFIRSLLTDFFNLVFFSILGILVKITKDKKITICL